MEILSNQLLQNIRLDIMYLIKKITSITLVKLKGDSMQSSILAKNLHRLM